MLGGCQHQPPAQIVATNTVVVYRERTNYLTYEGLRSSQSSNRYFLEFGELGSNTNGTGCLVKIVLVQTNDSGSNNWSVDYFNMRLPEGYR